MQQPAGRAPRAVHQARTATTTATAGASGVQASDPAPHSRWPGAPAARGGEGRASWSCTQGGGRAFTSETLVEPSCIPASLPGSRGCAGAAVRQRPQRGVPAGCQPPSPLFRAAVCGGGWCGPAQVQPFEWYHPGDQRRTPSPDRSCVARHLTVVRPAEDRQAAGSFPETCQPCPYA